MVAEHGSINLPLTEEKIVTEFQFLRNSLSNLQGDYTSKLLKQGETLGEALTMVKQLNAKVDAIKIQADLNDDYVKSQVDAKTIDITDKLTQLSQAGHTTWNELETVKQRASQYEEQLQSTNGQVSEILIRMKDLQSQPFSGMKPSSFEHRNLHVHFKTLFLIRFTCKHPSPIISHLTPICCSKSNPSLRHCRRF